MAEWPQGPFRALPGGVQFRVALRRCLRVGSHAGAPVEDLGVVPDVRHRLTRRDLLESNVDLMTKAGSLLAERTPRRLDAKVTSRAAGRATLEITTEAVDSLDIYVDGRPVHTTPVEGETTTASVSVPSSGEVSVRIEGFDAGALVAARNLTW